MSDETAKRYIKSLRTSPKENEHLRSGLVYELTKTLDVVKAREALAKEERRIVDNAQTELAISKKRLENLEKNEPSSAFRLFKTLERIAEKRQKEGKGGLVTSALKRAIGKMRKSDFFLPDNIRSQRGHVGSLEKQTTNPKARVTINLFAPEEMIDDISAIFRSVVSADSEQGRTVHVRARGPSDIDLYLSRESIDKIEDLQTAFALLSHPGAPMEILDFLKQNPQINFSIPNSLRGEIGTAETIQAAVSLAAGVSKKTGAGPLRKSEKLAEETEKEVAGRIENAATEFFSGIGLTYQEPAGLSRGIFDLIDQVITLREKDAATKEGSPLHEKTKGEVKDSIGRKVGRFLKSLGNDLLKTTATPEQFTQHKLTLCTTLEKLVEEVVVNHRRGPGTAQTK